jgi:hypothetical protein
MDISSIDQFVDNQTVEVEDVKRLLDVGRLLFSVLTPVEIEAIHDALTDSLASEKIGNAGDS